MPIKKAAFKHIRKSSKKHLVNISAESELQTLVKSFENLVKAKKTDEAVKLLPRLISKIDRAASKGIIKTNSASRKISRLMKKLSSPSKPSA